MDKEDLLKSRQIYIETLEELENAPMVKIMKRGFKKLIEDKIAEIDKYLEEEKW